MSPSSSPFLVSAAIALSKTLDYYADAETSDMSSSPVVATNSEDGNNNEEETADKNNRSLYDKAGKAKTVTGRRGPSGSNQDGEDDSNIVSSNIKTIVVICSKWATSKSVRMAILLIRWH